MAGLVKAIVATRGRTGSSAVIDELGRTPFAWSAQEVFSQNPDREYYEFPCFVDWDAANAEVFSRLEEPARAEVYLVALEGQAAAQGSQALFWKALSLHFFERPYLADLVHRRGYQVVWLTRGAVRQVISGMIAAKRGRYNTHLEFVDRKRYRINLKKLRELVRIERELNAIDRQALVDQGLRVIEADYESYLADRPAFYARIFGFLGLPQAVPDASKFQVMIEDLRKTIRNYDEVSELAAELGEPL